MFVTKNSQRSKQMLPHWLLWDFETSLHYNIISIVKFSNDHDPWRISDRLKLKRIHLIIIFLQKTDKNVVDAPNLYLKRIYCKKISCIFISFYSHIETQGIRVIWMISFLVFSVNLSLPENFTSPFNQFFAGSCYFCLQLYFLVRMFSKTAMQKLYIPKCLFKGIPSKHSINIFVHDKYRTYHSEVACA